MSAIPLDPAVESLCARLGLGAAINPAWHLANTGRGLTALRLIFMPSFDPFGCLTLTGLQSDPHCEIRFVHRLAHPPTPILDPHHEESFGWPPDTVAEISARVKAAFAEIQAPCEHGWATLDGMPVACISCTDGLVQHLEQNLEFPAYNQLQVLILHTALTLAQSPFVHNRLAHCLRYHEVEVDLRPEPGQPGQPPIARLAVLGPDDDRGDLALGLNAHKRRPKPTPRQRPQP